MKNVKAVILCLGEAQRMRPLSLGLPKSLIKFCNKPLLVYSLELLERHNVVDVLIVAGLGDINSDIFCSWCKERGMRITVVRYGLMFGSGGVLRKLHEDILQNESTDELLVLFGDNLLDIDFSTMRKQHMAHKQHGGLVTVAYHSPEDLIPSNQTNSNYGVLSVNNEGRIIEFNEKPIKSQIDSPYASAGVFLINRRAIEMISDDYPVDLSKHFLSLLVDKKHVFGFDIGSGFRYDIGTLDEYKRRQFDYIEGRLLLDNVRPLINGDAVPSGIHCRIKNELIIGDKCAIHKDAVLRGPVVIGDGVTIAADSLVQASIILDGVILKQGVKVTGSILGPHSILGKGVVIKEGSVIGPWSRINYS